MALQTHIKINGISVENAYISISQIRSQKVYEKLEDGTISEGFVTFANIGGAVNKDSWVAGDRFSLNHMVSFVGDLTRADIYTQLKTQKIDMYELDFTQAIDV